MSWFNVSALFAILNEKIVINLICGGIKTTNTSIIFRTEIQCENVLGYRAESKYYFTYKDQ